MYVMCVYIVYHSDNRKKLHNVCILLFNHHKIFTCLNNFNDIHEAYTDTLFNKCHNFFMLISYKNANFVCGYVNKIPTLMER